MYIKVIVAAGAKRESLKKKKSLNSAQDKADTFEVSVKEKTERNMANERVVELVAEHFKVQTNKVRIINGHHRPHKLISINTE